VVSCEVLVVSSNLLADFGGFHFGSVLVYLGLVYFDWFQLNFIFWLVQPIFQPICCFPTNFHLILAFFDLVIDFHLLKSEMVIKSDLILTTSVLNSPMISFKFNGKIYIYWA
jgi:hypothetical protein